MENAGGEAGGEESSSPGQGDHTLQDGSEEETTVPPAQDPGPESDDPIGLLHLDHGGANEDSPTVPTSEQDNVAEMPLIPHLSNLNISADMEDQDPLTEDEEEELIVLDPDHPVVRRQQVALSSQLSKQLERINQRLREKLEQEKADTSYLQGVNVEMFRIQEHLGRLQTKLEDHHHNKALAEAKHQQAQDQLEAMKSQYSSITSQDKKAKANVSQLQVELDSLMLNLVLTQGVSEDLRSNVKVMKNTRHKAAAEKIQAKEQKLKQDLYVERLSKDMERLTEQIAMYEAQASSQAEETKAAKEALSEAEMEMESLVMARKQLLQQWSRSLVAMARREEAFSAMQDAMCSVNHQVILLDREIEGYKKTTTEEEEQNETLTMQLNWSQMDITTTKKLISQKQTQQEALQTQYSTCLRIVRETEGTLARLSKESSTHQTEMNEQRRLLEKENAARLELEDKIMTHMQQKLAHNRNAKFSQKLTSKIITLKKEKISQLWQLENDVVAAGLESSEVRRRLDSLALTQEALDEEITKCNKMLTYTESKISSLEKVITQNQSKITNFHRKIGQIAASTGSEDLSPLHIKIEALKDEIEGLVGNIKKDQQLWMKQQGILVGLTQETDANSKDVLKLQTEYTGMQQKKIRLESQVEAERREEKELERVALTLRGDRQKLKSLLDKNGQLSLALEQENALMESDFLHRLKEAERESIEMQMKLEKTKEEKERLLNVLVEAERQIMLWEKKTQLVKETRSAVDSEVRQGHIQMMKAEIHRMEVRLNQLTKQQERLMRESEASVERRETIILRKEAMHRSPHKQNTKGGVNLGVQGLKRKIKDAHKHLAECEEGIKALRETQVSVSGRLAQQKQQLIELHGTSCGLEPDIVNLQDTKERRLANLVALQSRSKKLKRVREGSYQTLSTSQSVEAALQSQVERIHATSTIIHRVCEEFPQHQGALRRLALALAARKQEQEAS